MENRMLGFALSIAYHRYHQRMIWKKDLYRQFIHFLNIIKKEHSEAPFISCYIIVKKVSSSFRKTWLHQNIYQNAAWYYWISLLLFEFLTAESDWKFLLIQMFNNRKCSLDMGGIYSQKHIQNPACQISLGWSFSWK